VVNILLGLGDINPAISDVLGRTPLQWAKKRGLGGAVKVFLRWTAPTPQTA